MSTDKPKSQPKTLDEQIDSSIVNLGKLIERKVKTEGMTPEFTFGTRVAEAVKKNWETGKIPTEDEVRQELLTFGVSKNPMTSGALMTKASRITSLALFVSKCEKIKADLKKDNKDISVEELEKKASPLIESLKKSIGDKSKPTESTSQ